MHIKIIKKIISAAFPALILFLFNVKSKAALPLTETIYTIPENGIDLTFCEEILRINKNYRKETYSLGIGVLPNLSLWYSFEYINDGINASESKLGDSFLKIWFYIDEYYNIFHAGFLLFFRIPTGVNAYTDYNWRNVSFGNNELKIGPVFQIDTYKSIFIHLNLFYVFRQGANEDFYGGFYLNPTKKETYSKLFGLNFKSKNAFFESDKLKNDYLIHSIAFNTNLIYPIIPYIEFYTSHRIYKKYNNKYDDIPIEGAGIIPIFISFGGRYFFSEQSFFGFYYIYNLKREKNFIKDIFGFDFSLQF